MLLSPADCQEVPYESLKPRDGSVAVCSITGSATGRGTSLHPIFRELHLQRIGNDLDELQESCYYVAGSASVANRIILESTKVHIHVAGESDIDGIQAVGRSAWRDTYTGIRSDEYIYHALAQWWSRDYLKAVIASGRHILLVAEENHRIIGITETQILADRRAVLWKLYVLKEHRGQGIGTSLIEESIRRLPSGVEVYYTEYDSKNTSAAGFYASRGFVFDRIEEGDFRGTSISSVYVKKVLHETGSGGSRGC